MNIFYLDPDPIKCAEYHCDKHVVKMILEYTQLLYTAHRVLDGEEQIELSKSGRKVKRYRFTNPLKDKVFYHATHVNHPSALYTRRDLLAYKYVYDLLVELHKEYKKRYNKLHKCFVALKLLNSPPKNIKNTSIFSAPPQAMPENFKDPDAVTAYRNYYVNDKKYIAKWAYTPKPEWFP
jgi:hypothetical protein